MWRTHCWDSPQSLPAQHQHGRTFDDHIAQDYDCDLIFHLCTKSLWMKWITIKSFITSLYLQLKIKNYDKVIRFFFIIIHCLTDHTCLNNTRWFVFNGIFWIAPVDYFGWNSLQPLALFRWACTIEIFWAKWFIFYVRVTSLNIHSLMCWNGRNFHYKTKIGWKKTENGRKNCKNENFTHWNLLYYKWICE